MKGARLARDALTDHFGVGIDQNAHDVFTGQGGG
jgi:hypothetical protein